MKITNAIFLKHSCSSCNYIKNFIESQGLLPNYKVIYIDDLSPKERKHRKISGITKVPTILELNTKNTRPYIGIDALDYIKGKIKTQKHFNLVTNDSRTRELANKNLNKRDNPILFKKKKKKGEADENKSSGDYSFVNNDEDDKHITKIKYDKEAKSIVNIEDNTSNDFKVIKEKYNRDNHDVKITKAIDERKKDDVYIKEIKNPNMKEFGSNVNDNPNKFTIDIDDFNF